MSGYCADHGGAVWWPAPAKLNLMLRIIGRRKDGYHLLQSVFQFLDYGDRLRFTPRPDRRIRRVTRVPGVEPEQDLVVRAARLLQQRSGVGFGVDIEIDKRLPMGGGLGGGSSDAATTLWVLNRQFHLGLDERELADLGLTLGADVPIFLFGRAAWAEGVGERLLPIEPGQPWYLVLVPDCQVSTAEIFGAPELTRESPRITIRDFLGGSRVNDCCPVVRARYPAVAMAMDWLGRHAQAHLTGTGGCVFAPFSSEERARAVLNLRPEGLGGFVARGLNRSPLQSALQQA